MSLDDFKKRYIFQIHENIQTNKTQYHQNVIFKLETIYNKKMEIHRNVRIPL